MTLVKIGWIDETGNGFQPLLLQYPQRMIPHGREEKPETQITHTSLILSVGPRFLTTDVGRKQNDAIFQHAFDKQWIHTGYVTGAPGLAGGNRRTTASCQAAADLSAPGVSLAQTFLCVRGGSAFSPLF